MSEYLSVGDYFFIYSITVIWVLLLVNIFLIICGYIYYRKSLTMDITGAPEEYPFVSIMVPAHNEAKVIGRTVDCLMSLDYPRDRYEIIIINDNSTDNSEAILFQKSYEYLGRNLKIINTDNRNGGRGKSNALNIGYAQSRGEYIAIYDADNTPERAALKYLIHTIHPNPKLGAVIGKFRTRNRNRNLLTRFINIETLSFQWMAQAGRWQMFRLCTIPGTNFVIRRSIIDAIGGWDINAIAEDTEISFRIYQMGYKIMYVPQAVTWEQEPETVSVWLRQRTRWVKGNIYVIFKNLLLLFSKKNHVVKFDIIYFLSVYFFFLSAMVISDIIFVLGALGVVHLNVYGSSIIMWVLAYLLFVLEVSMSLTMEKGESGPDNLLLVLLMYFTYCQLWMLVAAKGFFEYIGDSINKTEVTWYKTERF